MSDNTGPHNKRTGSRAKQGAQPSAPASDPNADLPIPPDDETHLSGGDIHEEMFGVWNKRLARVNKESNNAEDFGTAMIWHRWVDANITEAIRVYFATNTKSIADKLFGYPAGLSTFSARIQLARCLGRIGPITFSDLATINQIRNDFSHPREGESGDLVVLSFNDEHIIELCNKLRFLEHGALFKYSYSLSPKLVGKERFVRTAGNIALGLWMCHGMSKGTATNPANLAACAMILP